MGDAGNWCLIESDPGVFTLLLREFGAEGLEFKEIFDVGSIANDGSKYHALILLFKWNNKNSVKQEGLVQADRQALNDVFFMKQVIQNACATQAIVSCMMNLNVAPNDPDVTIGPILNAFKHFTSDMDFENRGLALTNTDAIRTAHNSFAGQNQFSIASSSKGKPEDVFHFIAYMPKNGRFWEFDGLQKGPIDHGPVDGSGFPVEKAISVIQNRISQGFSDEIRFSLMGLVSSEKPILKRKLAQLEEKPQKGLDGEIEQIKTLISLEDEKEKRLKMDCIRRRHNYLPMIMEFFKVTASSGLLPSLVATAKSKTEQQKAVRKSKQAK